MFLNDVRLGGDWRDSGMSGMFKFVNRFYKLAEEILKNSDKKTENQDVLKITHKAIKRVGDDLEKLKFNTAIAAIMECTNSLYEIEAAGKKIGSDVVEILAKIIAPLAPFMAEELWNQAGHKESVFKQKWPEYNPEFVQDKEIELVIQVCGKLRDKIKVPINISEEKASELAKQSVKIKNYISEKKIKKIIFVKNRLVNIVTS